MFTVKILVLKSFQASSTSPARFSEGKKLRWLILQASNCPWMRIIPNCVTGDVVAPANSAVSQHLSGRGDLCRNMLTFLFGFKHEMRLCCLSEWLIFTPTPSFLPLSLTLTTGKPVYILYTHTWLWYLKRSVTRGCSLGSVGVPYSVTKGSF